VELVKPGQDTNLPANGLLRLEGSAADDFGLTALSLRMKDESGTVFPPKPYRPEKPLRMGDGNSPQTLDYKDFVELEKLKNQKGKPLDPGQVQEYCLEATDICDYPVLNIGQSNHYHVTIEKPSDETEKQNQNQQQPRQDQKK